MRQQFATCLVLLVYLVGGQWSLVAAHDGGLEQSNKTLSLHDFLSGVKYAYVELDSAEQAVIDRNKNSALYNNFEKYLRSIGFARVCMTTTDKNELQSSIPSLCDIARVKLSLQIDDENTFFANHRIQIWTCQGDFYRFSCSDTLYKDSYLLDKLFTVWKKMYNQKNIYSEQYRLSLPSQYSAWRTEAELQQYWQQRTNIQALEGIYEQVTDSPLAAAAATRMAIVCDTTGYYRAVYLSGATNYIDWQCGEYMGKISPTATQQYYLVHWWGGNKQLIDRASLTSSNYGNTCYLYLPNQPQQRFTKSYTPTPIVPPPAAPAPPPASTPRSASPITRNAVTTGSGVAVSPDGYVVTNSHVVSEGDMFMLETTQQGVKQVYEARLVLNDPDNDLAVLRITDPRFTAWEALPYGIRTEVAGLGESVFTLGYPLAATMGDNVKLANGIVSSRSGFKNDPNTYQITVPVQPGHSGGPLFDEYGNLLGIVKSRHSEAFSVTYAIKATLIQQLLAAYLPQARPAMVPSQQVVPLPQLVKARTDFVFFVKVYK